MFRSLISGTYVFLLSVLVFLFFMSAVGMLIQAARTAHPPHLRNNWNALVIGLSYITLVLMRLPSIAAHAEISIRLLYLSRTM